MTPKQKLLAHIHEMHTPGVSHQPSRGATFQTLGQWHALQHHRYVPNHYHEGVNRGAGERPPGWRTGEGAVAR
jgi:hypothetical protein